MPLYMCRTLLRSVEAPTERDAAIAYARHLFDGGAIRVSRIDTITRGGSIDFQHYTLAPSEVFSTELVVKVKTP